MDRKSERSLKRERGRRKMCMRVGVAAAVVVLLAVFVVWQNNDLTVSRTVYRSQRVPADFDGFTIVQISDLHNKLFGEGQERLLEAVAQQEPDLIVITGDLVDRRRYDPAPAETFVEGAAVLAPVYYVCGNHEAWSGHYDEVKRLVERAGGVALENEAAWLTRGGSDSETVLLLGMADPAWTQQADPAAQEAFPDFPAKYMSAGPEGDEGHLFSILLAHRPELVETYADWGVDLVFSGHAHGGQFRIPGLGGLVAPDQGLFPKYTSGAYTEGSTTMFVSRGLGNSIIPVRVFNRPEIVVVELSQE